MSDIAPVSYRFSSLARGFLLFWRGSAVTLPVLLATAVVQSLLFANPITGADPWVNALTAIANATLGLVAAGLIAAASVALVRGHRGSGLWGAVIALLREHALRYTVWSLLLTVVLVAGFALWIPIGIVLMALTPFVLIGAFAADGSGVGFAPIAYNFSAIARRFWRWLVTVLIGLLIAGIGYLVGGFVEFFLRGLLGSFVLWLAVGFCFIVFTLAFSLIAAALPRK